MSQITITDEAIVAGKQTRLVRSTQPMRSLPN